MQATTNSQIFCLKLAKSISRWSINEVVVVEVECLDEREAFESIRFNLLYVAVLE